MTKLRSNRFRVETFLYDLFSTNSELMTKIGNNLRMYRTYGPNEPSFPYFTYNVLIDEHGPENHLVTGALALSIYTLIIDNRYGQNAAIQDTIDDLLNSKAYHFRPNTLDEIYIQFYPENDRAVETDNYDIERTDLIYFIKFNSRFTPLSDGLN